MEPIFFTLASEFRSWLEENHEGTSELWVGFYKKGSGTPSITWPESVDQALCFGWIDGIRKGIDERSYTIRFTPRKARSIWSAVNIRHARELESLGLMHPAGLRAFEARSEARSEMYAYEQRHAALSDAYERQFRANERAWEFFQSMPPGYRKTATWWVISARKEETRLKRLAVLIEDSACGKTIGPLTRPTRPARAKERADL